MRATSETLDLLVALARAAGVEERRDAMFAGEKINVTEGRAVLHTALRNSRDHPMALDGTDVMPDVLSVLDAMAAFAAGIRSGEIAGATGKRFTDVVNIGDELKVLVISVDDHDRVKLSHRQALDELGLAPVGAGVVGEGGEGGGDRPERAERPRRDDRGGDRGPRGGGDRGGRGGGGGGRGGDRGGRGRGDRDRRD